MDITNTVASYTEQARSWLNVNKTMSIVVSLLLVLYAAMATARVPGCMGGALSKWYVRTAMVGVIAYLAYMQEPAMAVVVALALFVAIQAMSSVKTAQMVMTTPSAPVTTPITAPAPEVKVQVSEEVSKVIKEAFEEVNMHKEAAAKAVSTGAMAEAEAHMELATKKEDEVKQIISEQVDKAMANGTAGGIASVPVVAKVEAEIPMGNDGEVIYSAPDVESELGPVPGVVPQDVAQASAEYNVVGWEGPMSAAAQC